MNERIKLIWDFRGPNATRIAEHHVKHLSEFINSEGLKYTLCDVEKVTDMYCIAYMVVEKELMNELRERLKPNRGQIYSEGS